MALRRFRNIIGSQVKRSRVEHGWTQEELLAKLQIAGLGHFSRETLAKIESQIRSVYDYEAVIIARCLKVDLEALYPSRKDLKASLPGLIDGVVDGS